MEEKGKGALFLGREYYLNDVKARGERKKVLFYSGSPKRGVVQEAHQPRKGDGIKGKGREGPCRRRGEEL